MKCFWRFVSLTLATLMVWGIGHGALLQAASYGSGKSSYSSSRSSSSSSRRSSSSVFGSRSSGSSSNKSYSSSTTHSPKPSTPSHFDSDAGAAKRSSSGTSSGSSGPSGPSNSTYRSSSGNSYSSHANSTPAPSSYVRYTGRTPTSYRDRYSDMFWWWLLSRPRADRAQWAYHHAQTMDPARYRDLLEADQGLQQDVNDIAAKSTVINPNYVPPGTGPEMMYRQPERPDEEPPAETSEGRLWFWFWALGGSTFLIWFVFFKRWPVSTARALS